MMSPGLGSSERIRILSHLGQLTFFTRVANSPPPSSLSLRETPAQKGQSKISPSLTISGISNALPHPGQVTVLICVTNPKYAGVFPDQTLRSLPYPRQ